MIDARFRPLAKWSEKRPLQHRVALFKATYAKTLDLLEYELNRLKASQIVIEAGFHLKDIRNDGWPFSGRKPFHPGVILYFDGPAGSMRFPAGTYGKFEANMHALGLTLKALRDIDRYGVTMGNEQYKGFLAIGDAEVNEATQVQVAAETMFQLSQNAVLPEAILSNPPSMTYAYRLAVAHCHPDRGAKRELWDKLQAAKAILQAHFEAKGMKA